MHRDLPPPNPKFAAGMVYDGSDRVERNPPRINRGEQQSRDLGGAAARAAAPILPGFLKSIHDRVMLEQDSSYAAGSHEKDISGEGARQKYLEDIFAFPDPDAKDKYGNPYSKRTETTPESEEDAAYALRMSDQDIKDIVNSFIGESRLLDRDKPGFIRGNNDLRVALGMHILAKFKGMLTLPERVHRNSPDILKSPNHAGYPDKMLSRDYAAVVALSMIDGTFKERPNTGDTSHHRDAAEMVLGNHEQMKYCRWFYETHGVKMNKK